MARRRINEMQIDKRMDPSNVSNTPQYSNQSTPNISVTGIRNFIDAGRDDGYPVIVLIPTDEEYFSVMQSVLRRHSKRSTEKSIAIENWRKKIEKNINRECDNATASTKRPSTSKPDSEENQKKILMDSAFI